MRMTTGRHALAKLSPGPPCPRRHHRETTRYPTWHSAQKFSRRAPQNWRVFKTNENNVSFFFIHFCRSPPCPNCWVCAYGNGKVCERTLACTFARTHLKHTRTLTHTQVPSAWGTARTNARIHPAFCLLWGLYSADTAIYIHALTNQSRYTNLTI